MDIFWGHRKIELSPQWMICGLSSRQACLEFSTLTFHLRPAQRVSPRAYRKAKNTNNMKDWCKYKSLKAETQREMRRAHQAYIQDTVNQDLTANSKRFYSYVKSKKQETTGISPLLNQDGFLHSRSTSNVRS